MKTLAQKLQENLQTIFLQNFISLFKTEEKHDPRSSPPIGTHSQLKTRLKTEKKSQKRSFLNSKLAQRLLVISIAGFSVISLVELIKNPTQLPLTLICVVFLV